MFHFFLLREYYRITNEGFYIPMVVDAYSEKYYENKDYTAIALNIIQDMRKTSYKCILYFYQGTVGFPIYYVSLEKNSLFEELGGPSHFLCAFGKEQGHVNYGGLEEEITIENFAKKALEVVTQKYRLKRRTSKKYSFQFKEKENSVGEGNSRITII